MKIYVLYHTSLEMFLWSSDGAAYWYDNFSVETKSIIDSIYLLDIQDLVKLRLDLEKKLKYSIKITKFINNIFNHIHN